MCRIVVSNIRLVLSPLAAFSAALGSSPGFPMSLDLR
jgi:hypothetical protein